MKNNQLLSVRSNCDFSLNYETGLLHPQAEVILITSSPVYVIDKKKNNIVKDMEVSEYRFKSTLEGINKLIGELQLVVKNMNEFDQLAGGLNAIISSHKEQNKVTK